ncbi:expressed unknown protein [Seminavis robusta]|uniref:Uncharacterized protein n=1 Tax=Seminavis robusta TaxID=568900 RepID=A0A9N8DYD7_9STRA|nr:expressed unknown protein [Seminavis robusta]|eukprot:Sro462_g148090.1 n/a (307) ;mRNA; r:62617-63537
MSDNTPQKRKRDERQEVPAVENDGGKKQKESTTEAVAMDAVAASAQPLVGERGPAAEAPVTQEDVNKMILQALEGYVKKEDHEKLVAQALEGYVKKEDHEKLVARIDHVAGAFQPATEFALFETAVYVFVEPLVPSGDGWSTETVQHSTMNLCKILIDNLLEKKKGGFQWMDLSKKVNFPKEKKEPLLLSGLAGSVCYIHNAEKDAIEKWGQGQRNQLSHNGSLLDSLYASPQKDLAAGDYDSTKTKIKSTRKLFETEANSKRSQFTTVEDGVNAVVAALQKKGCTIEQEGITSSISGLKSQVKSP